MKVKLVDFFTETGSFHVPSTISEPNLLLYNPHTHEYHAFTDDDRNWELTRLNIEKFFAQVKMGRIPGKGSRTVWQRTKRGVTDFVITITVSAGIPLCISGPIMFFFVTSRFLLFRRAFFHELSSLGFCKCKPSPFEIISLPSQESPNYGPRAKSGP